MSTALLKNFHFVSSVAETKYDGSPTGGGAEDADEGAERRDAATNGSFVQRERASHARDRHTSRHDQGESLSFLPSLRGWRKKKKQKKEEKLAVARSFQLESFAFHRRRGNVINPSRSSYLAYRDAT